MRPDDDDLGKKSFPRAGLTSQEMFQPKLSNVSAQNVQDSPILSVHQF
jgi:hypothetical protein